MLGIGLHAYGFMDQAFKWLMAFDATQLIILAMGLIPIKYWRSFAKPGSGSSPTGKLSATNAPVTPRNLTAAA